MLKRKFVLAMVTMMLIATGIANAQLSVLARYDSNSGNPSLPGNVENPTVQGWTESGIDGTVTVEGVIDNGTPAWRIMDNGGQNPRYEHFLTASELQAMYDNGWEYVMVMKAIQGVNFGAWGADNISDPGWGLVNDERVGGSCTIVNDATYTNAFKFSPVHSSAVTLADNSADDFHTMRFVGVPQSSQYEFFVDGVSQGVFDISDGDSNTAFLDKVRWESGSSSGTGREAYWNYVSLTIPGIIISESDGSTEVAEEGETIDSYNIRLTSEPADTVTINIDPNVSGNGINIDLGAGPGEALALQWLPANWSEIKTVTVQAVDDSISEGIHSVIITHTISSNDQIYQSLNIPDVVVTITDNESYCGDENTSYSIGDINLDCYVNLKDFALLAMDWLKCTNRIDPSC